MDYEELILRAKEGDKSALEELIFKFKGFIIKRARCIYIKNYDMDDLIQAGYESVMKAIEKYDFTKGNFTAYVTFAIVKNYNYLIRGKAKENYIGSLDYHIEEDVELLDLIKCEENLEEDYVKNEIIKIAFEGLNTLPDALKSVMDYYINNKGTLKEYSEENNLKYNVVVKRKQEAKKLLRTYLRDRNIIE